jgi:hypothetical protein
MNAPRHRLTPELQNAIRGYILSGSYPHVAAEAAGLPREVFDLWLRRARVPRAKKRYRLFREAILQARALARLGAEAHVLAKNPLAWLKHGPGRDAPDTPDWSNAVRGQAHSSTEGRLLMRREVQEVVAVLLRVLQPFPEVRAAVADALDQLDQSSAENKQEE